MTESTTPSSSHCSCSHLTSFASSFFVPPNKLDMGAALLELSRLHQHPAMLATVCTVVAVFLVALVWARRKDKLKARDVSINFLESLWLSRFQLYAYYRYVLLSSTCVVLVIKKNCSTFTVLEICGTADENKIENNLYIYNPIVHSHDDRNKSTQLRALPHYYLHWHAQWIGNDKQCIFCNGGRKWKDKAYTFESRKKSKYVFNWTNWYISHLLLECKTFCSQIFAFICFFTD